MIGQDHGRMKRTPMQQAALAVRILNGRHAGDILERLKAELGDAALAIGPLDATRNPLKTGVIRLGVAYRRPPLVTGLSEQFATLLGDHSAVTTVKKYASAKGRPMPTLMAQACSETLFYRLGACWAGTCIGWSERAGQVTLQSLPPSVLEVLYSSDDLSEPVAIRHHRSRLPWGAGASMDDVVDEYNLADLDNPIFKVLKSTGTDNSGESVGYEEVTKKYFPDEEYPGSLSGKAYPWRYADGTPFHRIVITGTPLQPYRTNEAVEGTLGVAVMRTHYRAGVRDAGHPTRCTNGLRPVGLSSDSATGQTGIALRPGDIMCFENSDPDKVGSFFQFGPGFDPAVIGQTVRDDEAGLMQHLGLPTSMEQTGGAPTDLEAQQLEAAIASTYDECRRHDGEVLRRAAAIASANISAAVPEGPYGVLYGDEVTDALGEAEPKPTATKDAEEGVDNGRTTGSQPDT